MAREREGEVLDLTPIEMGLSMCKAYLHAAGLNPDPEALADLEQDRWIRLAMTLEEWLPACDGLRATEVAKRMRDRWARGDEVLVSREEAQLLAWEAVARHATALLDCDEIDNLPALERSWADWASARRPKLEV